MKTFALLLPGLLLMLTLHGRPGNPAPEEILENLRGPSQPFELSPERGRYALTMSVVENNSFFFTTPIARFVVPDLGYIGGKYVSLFAPGVSLLAVPLYSLGKSLGLAQIMTFSLSAIFAWANLVLIFLILRRLLGNPYPGLVAGLVFTFASPAWAYSATFYQHHLTTFLLLSCFYMLQLTRSPSRTFLIGILVGFSIFVEYPNVIFFIPLLLLLAYRYLDIRSFRDKISVSLNFSLTVIVAGLVLGLIPLLWYNRLAYNNPFQLAGTLTNVRRFDITTGQPVLDEWSDSGSDYSRAVGFFKYQQLPASLSVLLTSRDRGLIYFTPVLLLGLLGLAPLIKKDRSLGWTAAGVIFAVTALYGMWGDPWGGWAFGPRYLIPAMAFLAVPLGTAIEKYGRKLWFNLLFFSLFLYSLAINLAGVLTTNQIPPSVETESASLIPRLTFLHNFSLLQSGISGSFIFRTYLSSYLSLQIFAIILYILIFSGVCLVYLHHRSSDYDQS
ncbi:MAG: hypothetical protein UX91_C0006G0042 [Candidatus Amesbacteria bacterium GW2011_GWB1_47_19]|nr:MAG: hypothetical protein UW51_C0002G0042 [Candidatus Amesbacteria bacterium GW2011_GWA1_44_24]KKU31367.1 MAG: hypothetical protein UX46_C0006G0159 [Candidatus Amesbacteria bacterium GW2011_GWC1_46_24]KKU66980.1 MAG: hypothetical protein UX91_C0006G0042 [Candidatus Amesbacteria bacterium GW2011_GWB1_47_19]OGD05687.1 MAG: hypothetical protein A2379_05575 [Candidatus Amesbacteria bacterium RIFOXYB1_FULL_47_13]HBC72802.1 hypothetical protein [Candidatus Amesbacteria bacterium]